MSDEEKEEQNETEDREPGEKPDVAMATEQESKAEVKDIVDEQKKQQKGVADKSSAGEYCIYPKYLVHLNLGQDARKLVF